MLTSLPGLVSRASFVAPRNNRGARHAWAIALLAVLIAAPPCRALEAELAQPTARAGQVWVEARLTDLFPETVARSLSRGMPATLQLHVALWRQRSGWFDHQEQAYDASIRIRYEVWSDTYRIERSGGPPLTLGTLDSVAAWLSRPLALPAAPLWRLEPGVRYYVTLAATLAPLKVEDVQEVEGWLSGEVETHRHSGFGVFTELPLSLFDAVRNFAGFGDRHARAQSTPFALEDLPSSAEVVPGRGR